jgi:hypothetical protein
MRYILPPTSYLTGEVVPPLVRLVTRLLHAAPSAPTTPGSTTLHPLVGSFLAQGGLSQDTVAAFLRKENPPETLADSLAMLSDLARLSKVALQLSRTFLIELWFEPCLYL